MKRLLLFLFLLPALPVLAQVELGINLGAATNTKPDGNLAYQGNKSPLSGAASLKGIYNINDVWQAGLDVSLTQLKRKSDKAYTYHGGGTIGGDDKNFVLARTYTSACGIVNAKLVQKNGYLYSGAAIGYGVARHNSKTLNSNESYRAPDGGKGLVLGIQLGLVSGITKNLGWNVEAAARRIDLKYDAIAPNVAPSSDLHYNMYDFMLTVGLRLRFSKDAIQDREAELQGAMNVGG